MATVEPPTPTQAEADEMRLRAMGYVVPTSRDMGPPISAVGTEQKHATIATRGQKRTAILDDIKNHPELAKLGRNAAARELVKLGHEEAHSRRILSELRRADGYKKFVSGEIIHLPKRR
jgi:hypothetical protein